jgi:lipopolysaccharide heptosyltransferase II
MKILVRLPNWLGDLVMSAAFIEQLQKVYPGSEISVIVKKGLEQLLSLFPPVKDHFIFSKQEFPGLKGAFSFGKIIKQKNKFDIFFSLPDSFSSALMGYATGTKKCIGYKKELRSFLLTNSYNKNNRQHRVEQYLDLLRFFSGKDIEQTEIKLRSKTQQKNNIIININSVASSRKLPKEKAVSIIENIRKSTPLPIILIGAANEKPFVEEVFNALTDTSNIKNVAGAASLPELANLMGSAKVVLTTDSGPAHLSNALGVYTVILFGAGNEKITAPVNQNKTIIRLAQLSCEPCEDNKCKRFGIPKCLTLLNEDIITNEVIKHF